MGEGVGFALVIGIVFVVVFYSAVDFIKSLIDKFSTHSRGHSHFTAEEDRAFYRGIRYARRMDREREDYRRESPPQVENRPRTRRVREVRRLDRNGEAYLEQQREWEEEIEEIPYIREEEAPQPTPRNSRKLLR